MIFGCVCSDIKIKFLYNVISFHFRAKLFEILLRFRSQFKRCSLNSQRTQGREMRDPGNEVEVLPEITRCLSICSLTELDYTILE